MGTHDLIRTAEQDPEMMRLQILGDPQLMAQLRQVHPLLRYIIIEGVLNILCTEPT